MENLSLVIKDNLEENIYSAIKMLSPLLDDGKTQLILINNIKNNFQIDYEHIIYEFEEDYEKFYEFCDASSFNNNIMIIEDSMILTEELVREVKEQLLQHKNVNIKVDLRKYYYEDNYYKEEKIIIYNNKSSKDVKMNIEIDDFTFLNNLGINLKHNISRFIQDEKFSELYLWYKNYIIKDEDAKFRFYNYIEKCKIELEDNIRESIDRYFILEELDSKYCEYLKIIKMIKEDKLSEYYLKNIIRESNFNERDVYFSYTIFECFKRKKLINPIFTIIDQTVVEIYMKKLFAEYNCFYLYIYDFLNTTYMEEELINKKNENVLIYMKLIEIYCENMSSDSVMVDKKEKMVQLFEYYSSYGIYLLNNNFAMNDKKRAFLAQLNQAIKFVNLKRIKEAIIVLKEISEIYEHMTMATRYYLQKVMREYNSYKCKLSICIMAKNEEKFLEKCLRSIKPLIDNGIAELIFVDTGSTDRTVDIASKYTNDIYIKTWQGNFSEMRNYCISLAQGEYLFIPDADEEVELTGIKKLVDLFSEEDYKKYYTYTLKERNYEDNEFKKYAMNARMFIFKNEGEFCYYGKIHEQPNFKQPVKSLDVMVNHSGYIMNSKEVRERKFNRTEYILKKELEKEPLNIYYRYQLTKSYSVYGDHKESLNQAKLFMRILNNISFNSNYIMYYNAAAVVYFCNKLYDEAIKTCDNILRVSPDFIDALYFKAQSSFLKENYEESIKCYKCYLNLLSNIHDNSIMNDTRLEFYSIDSSEIAEKDIMVAYLKLQNYSEFIEYALTKDNHKAGAYQFGMIISYIQLNQFKELAMFYKINIHCASENDKLDFIYYIKNQIENLDNKDLKMILDEFNKLSIKDEYLNLLKKCIEKREKNSLKDIIRFLAKQDMQNLNILMLEKAIYDFIIILINNKDMGLMLNEIIDIRKVIKNVLVQILNKKSINGLNNDQILSIIFKYMDYSFLVYKNSKQSLNEKEILFLENITISLKHIQKNDLISAVRSIKHAVLEDEEMANAMALYIENLIDSNEDSLASKEMESYSLIIKSEINKLIEQGNYEEAKKIISEYETIDENDLEVISMKAVVFIVDNKLDEAEIAIKEGLELDSNNFDLLYNLAYIYEIQQKHYEAIRFYNISKENANCKETIVEIDKMIDKIKTYVK